MNQIALEFLKSEISLITYWLRILRLACCRLLILTLSFVLLSGMAVEDVVSAKLVLSKLKEGGAPLSTL